MPVIERLVVAGDAYERGRQHGRLAVSRVAATVAMYRWIFAELAGLEWSEAVRRAARYEEGIASLSPSYLDELRGIADGSGHDYGEIVAINARTEIMYSAVAAREGVRAADGCSAVALSAEASATGEVRLAQNWDWNPRASDNVIVLEVDQRPAPRFVTVVEAGLLAKTGMNEAGVGVATNALVSSADAGEPGAPFHALLRAVLDCEDAGAASALILGATRSSSANYLLADATGSMVDIEGASGPPERGFAQQAVAGRLTHTNHFGAGAVDAGVVDVMPDYGPSTITRLGRLRELLGEGPVTDEQLRAAFADHAGYPGSICQHADESRPPAERARTLASVIYGLGSASMWCCAGNPCAGTYERVPIGWSAAH